MIMKNPDDDVMLTDGEGYFCRDGPYQHHLKTAVYYKEKVGMLTSIQACFLKQKCRNLHVPITRLLMRQVQGEKISTAQV